MRVRQLPRQFAGSSRVELSFSRFKKMLLGARPEVSQMVGLGTARQHARLPAGAPAALCHAPEASSLSLTLDHLALQSPVW